MRKTDQYIWVIAFIDKTLIHKLQSELDKNNQYIGLEAQIPLVKILKKEFKGQEHYEEVPLLFYYGFFKIPLLYAVNWELLDKIKDDISCIVGWVKDPAKVWKSKSRSELTKPILLGAKDVPCATATSEEVARLVKIAEEDSIHSSSDVDRLEVGSIINLIGYPFEDMQARIESIDKRSRKMEVSLKMDFEIGGG